MTSPCAVTLRPARSADMTVMATLSRQLIEAGLPWRYTPRRMAGFIADPETVALVAHDAQQVQGFAVMQFGDEAAHLVLLCVRPALQGQGVGRCLLEWLLKSARVAGMAQVGLELRADNTEALAFYGRMGFAETALVPGYYDGSIAARRMQLLLRG